MSTTQHASRLQYRASPLQAERLASRPHSGKKHNSPLGMPDAYGNVDAPQQVCIKSVLFTVRHRCRSQHQQTQPKAFLARGLSSQLKPKQPDKFTSRRSLVSTVRAYFPQGERQLAEGREHDDQRASHKSTRKHGSCPLSRFAACCYRTPPASAFPTGARASKAHTLSNHPLSIPANAPEPLDVDPRKTTNSFPPPPPPP